MECSRIRLIVVIEESTNKEARGAGITTELYDVAGNIVMKCPFKFAPYNSKAFSCYLI